MEWIHFILVGIKLRYLFMFWGDWLSDDGSEEDDCYALDQNNCNYLAARINALADRCDAGNDIPFQLIIIIIIGLFSKVMRHNKLRDNKA